jgi:hypothetical protein
MKTQPFYCNYAVWDAVVDVVAGTDFTASLSPAKDIYTAGEGVTVKWGVDNGYFTADSRVRITMSANYGESFDYVLAESVPASNGSCSVGLPDVNVGNVDVDFVTAIRSMRGGIIKVEEIGGVAYTLTALSPELGGSFCITGATNVDKLKTEMGKVNTIYDLQGRKLKCENGNLKGIYIIDGKKALIK